MSLNRPLADALRPKTLDEVVGQDHLLGEKGAIRRMLETEKISSFILWGPAGCGKTTIARLFSNSLNAIFEPISAVFSGVADLKAIFKRAEGNLQKTILFVDEIHRFNRSQQDSFLPYVEAGVVTLIGATTENPSFELNSALLSRCKVFVLHRLDAESLKKIIERAEDYLKKQLPLTEKAKEVMVTMADGDGRYLINLIESVLAYVDKDEILDEDGLMKVVAKRPALYDKDREEHYNLISALHKSMRGSDTDAALYWLARMLSGGEDPRYILRRLSRFAFEDIGLADPQAAAYALTAWEMYERLGSPEGELMIAELVIYLSSSPKSNKAYVGFPRAMELAKKTGSLMPPKHILNAPTKLMQEIGYGSGYKYDHDEEDGVSGQDYFPEGIKRQSLYTPKEIGFEREIKKRMEYFNGLRKKKNEQKE